MKLIHLGDINGRIAREAVKKVLPALRKDFEPDLVIANAENLSHGLGVSKKTLLEMSEAGVDIFTSGNHVWDKKEVYEVFGSSEISLLRPANYPPQVPGIGYKIFEVGSQKVLVASLAGRVFMDDDLDCPFRKMDEIIAETKLDSPLIVIDFHAEATSEKIAFANYLDGRANAVVGTHTHVQTADDCVLPKGTAYITDAGMCGAKDSILGVNKTQIIKTFLTQIRETHEIPESGTCVINGVFLEIGKGGNKIERIWREVEV